MSLHNVLHQEDFKQYRQETAEWLKNAYAKSLSTGELSKFEGFANPSRRKDLFQEDKRLQWDFINNYSKAREQELEREEMAKAIIAKQFSQIHKPNMMSKAGVNTALGFNFYDLRAPVSLLYPVHTPMRNRLPRLAQVNAGVGTAAHWMATRNPGFPYAGLPEGQRGAIGTPDNNNYTATYKEIGVDRAATFTSQFAGEGFADNVGDEHIRGLHSLFLQEEGMIWCGNGGAGSGVNGYTFGTAPTPTTALVATNLAGSAAYTAAFTTSSYVSVAVVVLSGMGNPATNQYGYQAAPTVAGGLTPSFSRSSAVGETVTVNGGMSAISAISSPLQCTSGNLTIKASIPTTSLPIKGAFGYAWFVDTEASSTNSAANTKLAAITSTPYVFLSGTATGTQASNAAGLSTDHTANSYDFDGLLTFAATTSGAYWKDLSADYLLGNRSNNSLVSAHNGRCTEIEDALLSIFSNYQANVDEIWCSTDAATALDSAIRYNGTTATGYQFQYTRDSQNNLLGGFVVSAYQSRYAVANPMGAQAIPIRIHPMIPAGTIYFGINTNPYPQSRAPFVAGMMTQRDYYSIEWPVTTRQWTFGTYVHEVLAHHIPWITGCITGIGAYVAA